MRIGLTGADGVLGGRIAAELARAREIVIPFAGDVRDVSAVRSWAAGCELLVHAAALVPTRDVEAAPGEAISVNVGGSANLAQASRELGRRLVYISTSHVYAADPSPLNEQHPTFPSSFYGLTKLQGEECIRYLAHDPLIIRVFSYFDARQRPPFLVPSLRARICEAERGAELTLFGASHIRDLVDGPWAAAVIARLIRGGGAGLVNCGCGQPRTILEIAQTLAASLGRADVRWRPANDPAETSLVADTAELVRRIGALPPFSLEQAFDAAFAQPQDAPHG